MFATVGERLAMREDRRDRTVIGLAGTCPAAGGAIHELETLISFALLARPHGFSILFDGWNGVPLANLAAKLPASSKGESCEKLSSQSPF
jgi:hypothetical protein